MEMHRLGLGIFILGLGNSSRCFSLYVEFLQLIHQIFVLAVVIGVVETLATVARLLAYKDLQLLWSCNYTVQLSNAFDYSKLASFSGMASDLLVGA